MTPPLSGAGVLLLELLSRFGDGTKIANKPPANPPLPRFGQIQMALVLALQERRDRLRAGVPMQPQQHVVMAVEDGSGFWRGHLQFLCD